MRTKTLLLAAALTAVGIATSMAQVYSVNAVGYVRTSLKPGFNMISNPLNATSNKISDLFKNVDGGVPTEGFALYKYNGTGYDVAFIFDDGSVDGTDFTLAPGEGAFVQNSSATAKTITFVGEVPQNTLTTTLRAGFQIVSSQVPQAGTLDVDLKYAGADQDTAYQFDSTTQAYKTPATLFFDDPSNPSSPASWDPAAPVVAVGESFWLLRAAAGSWTRTFSVNATQ